MSSDTSLFQLARTINDDNEVHIKFTRQYLTLKEIMIIAMGIPIMYFLGALIGLNGLVTVGALFVYMYVACHFINAIRRKAVNKQSYIWDFMYRRGMFSDQRGWLRASRREKILGSYHQCGPHVFLKNAKTGDLLAVDVPFRRMMPPGGGVVDGFMLWKSLAIWRGRLSVVPHHEAISRLPSSSVSHMNEHGSRIVPIRPLSSGHPAPSWWHGVAGSKENVLGHERVIHIYLPYARQIAMHGQSRD